MASGSSQHVCCPFQTICQKVQLLSPLLLPPAERVPIKNHFKECHCRRQFGRPDGAFSMNAVS